MRIHSKRVLKEFMRRVEGKEELDCELCGGKAVFHLTSRVKGTVKERHLCEDCARKESKRGAICFPFQTLRDMDPERLKERAVLRVCHELSVRGGMGAEELEETRKEFLARLDAVHEQHESDPGAANEAMIACVKEFMSAKIPGAGAVILFCFPVQTVRDLDPGELKESAVFWGCHELSVRGEMGAGDLEEARKELLARLDAVHEQREGDPEAAKEAMIACLEEFLSGKLSDHDHCARCGKPAVTSITDAVRQSTEYLCADCAKEAMPRFCRQKNE